MSVRSMRRKPLTDSDRTKLRSFATAAVLEKTDRILGPKVKVRVKGTRVNAPGYTDGENIYINGGMEPIKSALMKGFNQRTMMLVTGLNYHELAHCLFTPRLDSNLVRDVQSEGAFMAFNVLEDQAAETTFVKRYEPARHYFTALVTDYMMDNNNMLSINYPLVSGRLFLPASLRKKFRDAYAFNRIVDDVDELVARYKTLVYPRDEKAMYDTIIEFHELLDSTTKTPPIMTPHDNLRGGEQMDEIERQRIVREDEFVNDDEDDDENDEATQSIPSDEEDSDGEPEDSEPEDGEDGEVGDGEEEDESESSFGGSDDGKDDGEDESAPDDAEESEGGDGGSSQPYDDLKRSSEQQRREVREALDEVFDEAMEEVEHELDDRIHSVQEEERNYKVLQPGDAPTYERATPEDHALVRRCTDELAHAKVQQMPGWHRQQRHGKLDPRRYAKALKGYDTVFKRWREGINDIVEFEVTFLEDQSGSMSSRMRKASIALWVLRRTFEEHDGITTVLGFEDEARLLSQRGDVADRSRIPIYGYYGSTYVSDALEEAKRILATSRKTMRLCVIITDGGFHDSTRASNVIRMMDSPVAIVGIDQDVSRWEGHRNIIHQQTITDPMELVEVVKNLALNLSDEYANKRGQ